MGSCYIIHPPLCSIPSSSHAYSSCASSSSQSICIFSPLRVSSNGRKSRQISSSLDPGSKNERNLHARRAILFVGFSVLPVLKMTAMSLRSLASDGSDLKASEQGQVAEETHEGNASGNPLVSVLSAVGILGSGILTALYALALKENESFADTIESMRGQLADRKAKIIALKEQHESEMMKEIELRHWEVSKAREDRQALINQWKSANETIVILRQDLQKETKAVKELKLSIDSLLNRLSEAGKDNKELEEKLTEKLEYVGVLQEKINFLTGEIKDKDDNLQRLSSAVSDKESQLQELSAINQQLQDQIAGLSSENEELKEKLLKNAQELEVKTGAVDDLNARVGVLLAEKEESIRKFESIQREYNEFQSSSQKKAAEDAKLLEDQERALEQIKEQLESTTSELGRNEVQVKDLLQERDDLRKMLDKELNNVKSLEEELQIKHETLEKSKNQVSELSRQLQQSRDLCFELEAEVSKVRADFAEARESLQRNTEEAKRNQEELTRELKSSQELLKKETGDKEQISHELASLMQARDELRKELDDVYKEAETAANELLQERASLAALKEEFKTFETQISKETEARKSLEKELEETVRSLDEMNQNAMVLARELEQANTQITSIEDEKEALYKSLAEQKKVSQEARENMEDAHSLILRLGEEKDSFEKRAKKLEKELASAKGEILRMRARRKATQPIVNDQHQEKVEVGAGATKAAAPVKRTRRRRKTEVQQEDSS